MAKLKTFEQFLSERDRAEDIQQDVIDMATPDTKGPEEAEEEAEEVQDAGNEEETELVQAEETEEETEEDVEEDVEEAKVNENPALIALAAQELLKKKEEEARPEDDEEEINAEEDEVEKDELEESVVAESEDSEEKVKLVSNMLQEAYESCKNEAKVWEEDAHDDHTVESYMVENAALIAALAAKSMNEMKEDSSTEAFESACNSMVESYTKKMNEMKESLLASDAGEIE